MAQGKLCRVYFLRLLFVCFFLIAVELSFEYLGFRNSSLNLPYVYSYIKKQTYSSKPVVATVGYFQINTTSTTTQEATLNEAQFLQYMKDLENGTNQTNFDLNLTQVCVTSTTCQPALKYMKIKADEYIAKVNKHLKKNRKTPVLAPYPDNMPRPNPRRWIPDPSMKVDYDGINREIEMEKERRMKLGDDDLSKNPAVQQAISKSTLLVPNIVHYIWFGCRKFKVHHYMSMLSAYRYQKPDLILFHSNCIPEGDYWNKMKSVVGNTLLTVKRSPPLVIFGRKINVVEHQADVARLEIVLEVGGMYVDTDVLFLKSFDELRKYKTVLAEESHENVGNGIIITTNNSWFLNRWFQEYKNFQDSQWGASSCLTPWAIWRLFPDSITVVKQKILRPNWKEVNILFKELWNWRENYAIHLYARFMKTADGTDERSLKELAVLNTTYGEVSRHVLWGDYHIRSPKDLLLM